MSSDAIRFVHESLLTVQYFVLDSERRMVRHSCPSPMQLDHQTTSFRFQPLRYAREWHSANICTFRVRRGTYLPLHGTQLHVNAVKTSYAVPHFPPAKA